MVRGQLTIASGIKWGRIYAHLIWRLKLQPRRTQDAAAASYLRMRFYCARNHFVVAAMRDFLRTHQFPRLNDWFIHERPLAFTQEVPFFDCCAAEICNEAHSKTMCYLLSLNTENTCTSFTVQCFDFCTVFAIRTPYSVSFKLRSIFLLLCFQIVSVYKQLQIGKLKPFHPKGIGTYNK